MTGKSADKMPAEALIARAAERIRKSLLPVGEGPLKARMRGVGRIASDPTTSHSVPRPSSDFAPLSHLLPQGEKGYRGAMPHQPVTDAKRSFARKLRREMTEAEGRLWEQLRDRRLDGLKFRRQAPIGSYVADFLCADAMLVVEVDGDVPLSFSSTWS